jgi:hypothetical protein
MRLRLSEAGWSEEISSGEVLCLNNVSKSILLTPEERVNLIGQP